MADIGRPPSLGPAHGMKQAVHHAATKSSPPRRTGSCHLPLHRTCHKDDAGDQKTHLASGQDRWRRTKPENPAQLSADTCYAGMCHESSMLLSCRKTLDQCKFRPAIGGILHALHIVKRAVATWIPFSGHRCKVGNQSAVQKDTLLCNLTTCAPLVDAKSPALLRISVRSLPPELAEKEDPN